MLREETMNTLIRKSTRWVLSALVLALLASAPVQVAAQIITGSLTGVVMDPSGAVIPAARVVMTNDASGDVRRTNSNADGYFTISGVMPGSYTILVEADGFNTSKYEKVTFTAGDRRTLGSVTLSVAATGSEVQVTAVIEELSPVDTGEKAVVLTSKQLTEVAVVGRSAAEFIKILPGMAATGAGLENRPGFNGENIGINGNGDGGKQSAIGNFSANGTRTNALDITADGAHVSDPGCNCANPVNPNPEMIEEFKVQQSNFSAEYAKGPVVLNSITKAGGRDFHGSAYLYARHFSMNANDWLNNANGQKRPENKYFFPGGTISGPVIIPGTNFNKNRDKMFFFAGFESFRQTIDTGLLRAVVPTNEMRQGDFSNIAYMSALSRAGANLGEPLSGTAFPNGRIPASQVDPGMRQLMNLVPAPNTDPATVGQGFNWTDVLVVNQNMWQSLNRVDFNINDNTKLFVRYNRQQELQPFPIQLWWRNAGAVPLPTPIDGRNRTDSISTNFTKVLSPTMTTETVFGYTFVDFPNSYRDYDKMTKSANNYPYQGIFKQDDKIPGFLSWAGPAPSLWLAGGFDPVLFATKHLYTLTHNWTKVAGTHTVKFGGYWGFIQNKQPGNEPSAGLAVYAPWHGETTGNILADMVRGVAFDYTENTLQINRDMGWHEIAFFAQDSWKVTPRFTLEYGMRLQHMQPWTARNGIGIATWVPDKWSASAPSSALPGIDWHARDSNVPLAGWATRGMWYAPRVGFAYDIFGKGKTVLRGGFGSFVYHDAQLAAGAMDLPAGVRRTSVCCGINLRDMDTIQGQGSLVFGGEAVDSTDDRQPITHSYSFTISQRLPARTLWEVSYVGNVSRNLVNEGGLRNINQVQLGAMLRDPLGDVNAYRPLRNWQDLNVNSHNFSSNYNSLQTTLTKQSGWLNYTFAYTWSKAMGIVNNPADNLVRNNNYGPLNIDRTHILAASYVVNVPDLVKSGNTVARGLANGWQISGIVQASSGVNLQRNADVSLNFAAWSPIPANDGSRRRIGGPELTGTNAISVMPRITCDPRSNLQPGQYINGSCFAAPIVDPAGNPGVNGSLIWPYLRGPAFYNADISVFKNFRMGESKNLQLRAQAYNFLNHPIRSFVNGDQNLRLELDRDGVPQNPRFGFADSKVGRRVIQLGIRFLF